MKKLLLFVFLLVLIIASCDMAKIDNGSQRDNMSRAALNLLNLEAELCEPSAIISWDLDNSSSTAYIIGVNSSDVTVAADISEYDISAFLAEGTNSVSLSSVDNAGNTTLIASASTYVLSDAEQFARLQGSKNFYFGNLHAHSKESDGEGSAGDGFRWARDTMNVDFYAVTDHAINMTLDIFRNNYRKIKDAADDYDDPGNFTAIAGFEWSSEIYGHMNCWFTSDYTNSYFGEVSRTDWYDWIIDNNGLGQFNHPGREEDLTFILDDEYMWRNFSYKASADAVIQTCETGNKSTGNNDLIYYALFLRGLARGWHLAPTSNWDNHNIDTYQHHRTVVITDSLSRNTIRSSIQNRTLYSTDDKNTRIIFKYAAGDIWAGTNPWMGSIVPRPASHSARLLIAVEDPGERIKKVQLVTSYIHNPQADGEDRKSTEILLAEYTPQTDTDIVTWYPEISLSANDGGNTIDVKYCLVKVIMENTEDTGCTGRLNQDPATMSADIKDNLLYITGLSSSDQMAVSAPIWFE